jgi:hypothetical protein
MKKITWIVLYFLFYISCIKAQVGYDFLKWYGKAEYYQGSPIRKYPSNFVLDTFNNGYGCISINGIARFGQDSFVNSNGIGGAVLKYSNKGELLWKIPVYGTDISFNKEGKFRNGQFVFIFNSISKSKIMSDSFPPGNVIVAVDSLGNLDYAKALPECAYTTFSSHKNTTLITIKVVASAKYFGIVFNPGIYSLEISRNGNLISYILIGKNLSSRINEIVTQANDSLLYFTAFAKKGMPFTGKDFQVRAIDSITHPGMYASDVFVACLRKNGDLKWLKRIDTMCTEPNIYSMSLTQNGNLFWCPTYYKSGVVFGKRAIVRFQGGSYFALAVLDAEDGAIKKVYRIDTVGGGNENGGSLFEMSGKMSVVLKASGAESFKLWQGVPDSAKNLLQQTCIIRFDSEGNYYQFNESPFYFLTINTFNPAFGSITGLFADASTKDYRYSNVIIPNNMGNDYYFMCMSIYAPNMNRSNYHADQIVKIFPNPVEDIIHLQSNIVYNKLELTDLQGKLIAILPMLNNTASMLEIPRGMYLLRASGEGESISKYIKIIKY